MQRNLNRLANERFDLLVIGGGIMGACLARDAALRGLSVALVERSDFANATSAHNSKLIHGGLRYLRNFEFGLVRESLQERKIWLRIAPHLVRPLPFLLPVADTGRRATIAAGLSLYDLLATSLGQTDNSGQRLPSHVWLDAVEARTREPCLESLPIVGAFRYFDAQMQAPERLALVCVLDAAEQGAVPANYLEAERLLLEGERVEGARVRDRTTDSSFDVRARLTILALGPWTDLFVAKVLAQPTLRLCRSKGIHVLVPRFTRTHALTIATRNSTHFFAIPWGDSTLLGTTDRPFNGDPDSVAASSGEIEDFIRLVNVHLPAVRLGSADVKLSYAGLRTLVDESARNTYSASRRAELIEFEKSAGLSGLMAVIGGKWTTARRVAQHATDRVVQNLAMGARSCTTATRLVPNNEGGTMTVQIARAVREEMAVSLEDVIMRRTGIGQEGDPGPDAIDRAATIMAGECGWSEAHRRAEMQSVTSLFPVSRQ